MSCISQEKRGRFQKQNQSSNSAEKEKKKKQKTQHFLNWDVMGHVVAGMCKGTVSVEEALLRTELSSFLHG